LPEFTPDDLRKLAPYLDFREIKYTYKRKWKIDKMEESVF
jgi:hypothetical protein